MEDASPTPDRCPRTLGTIVRPQEVQFHHEVYNQFLWNQFQAPGSRDHRSRHRFHSKKHPHLEEQLLSWASPLDNQDEKCILLSIVRGRLCGG
jgi:hypothetical protein